MQFLVEKDDDGIRPAGGSDECFYCRAKVGEPHGPECVCIVRDVTYEVYHQGRKIGTFTREDPAHWEEHDCEFHKNDSSWCADNIIDDSGYKGEPLPEVAEGDCLCSVLEFKVESMGAEVRRAASSKARLTATDIPFEKEVKPA